MKKLVLALLLTMAMLFGVCGAASAADAGALIGYVNVQQVFRSNPDVDSAMSAINLERQKAQKEFESKAESLDEKGRQELGQKLSEQVSKREQELMGPIQKKIRAAIEAVAKRNGIATVVEGEAVLYGGKNLTTEVIAEVTKAK